MRCPNTIPGLDLAVRRSLVGDVVWDDAKRTARRGEVLDLTMFATDDSLPDGMSFQWRSLNFMIL